MFKKFAWWFIVFGLSFLVQSWGLAKQGTAFLVIHLGGATIILLVATFLLLLSVRDSSVKRIRLSFVVAIIGIATLCVTILTTWCATKLFEIDFYVAYQIMTFGQCFVTTNSNKNSKKNAN